MAIALLVMMCLSFTACDNGSTTSKYSVWIHGFTWSSASTISRWATLSDGNGRIVELSASDFEWEKTNNFIKYNETEKSWTVDEIADQIQKWGFSSSKAKEIANSIVSYGHCEFGYRSGSNFYMMLK